MDNMLESMGIVLLTMPQFFLFSFKYYSMNVKNLKFDFKYKIDQ